MIDFEIPKQYGLRQTIADTLGIGGIMRGLRTIPVLMIDICADMEALCPDGLAELCQPDGDQLLGREPRNLIKTVGLCHSVQGTAASSCSTSASRTATQLPAAGINHMAFYLRLERDGEDLYPRLREWGGGPVPEHNRVRFELMRHFGYFVTESSEHFSEYVPWYIKRTARPDRPVQHPARRIPAPLRRQIAGWEAERARLESGDAFEVRPSHEYGSTIIRSIETGKPR